MARKTKKTKTLLAHDERGKFTSKRTLTDEQVLDIVDRMGSCNKAAQHLGVARRTFDNWYKKAARNAITHTPPIEAVYVRRPARGATRYIFTAAQDSTEIHEQFLTNLEAYAAHLGANLRIAGFTYNKTLYSNHEKGTDDTYHRRVEPYLCNERLNVADKLLFCGEMNTLPTAVNPLSGFETYTRSMWGVFPHPRITLTSVATAFNEDSKIIMTTGAVTLPNYIRKKAGIKAEFHHVIAALLVEVDCDGRVFCRHLIAEDDGSFQDLTTYVTNGTVYAHEAAVEAITWGDIHTEELDPTMALLNWGIGRPISGVRKQPLVDALRPQYQFFHDVADFSRRSHHNIRDPHLMYEMYVNGAESMEDAVGEMALFLTNASRSFSESIVVESNHDKMMTRWLREADYRADPVNAEFFLHCQSLVYKAIKDKVRDYSVFEAVVRERLPSDFTVTFLRESSSFMICPKASGGIECALHGHKGANGAKGNILTFAKMGPKANVGHNHSAGIHEGIYQAGTNSKLDLGYNRGGLSSWNHSDIVTYPNGKRIVLTKMGGRAWA